MITLYKTTINNKEMNSINARDLYTYLEIKSKFADWIKRRLIETKAIKNKDYIIQKQNKRFTYIEYLLTIDKAIEISMYDRNIKTKHIVDYLNQLNTHTYTSTSNTIDELNKQIEELTNRLNDQQLLLDTYDECYKSKLNKLYLRNNFNKLIKKYAYVSNQSVQSIYIQVYNTYRQLHSIPFNTKINIHYLEENIDRLVECTEIISHLMNQFIKSNDNSIDFF